MLCKNCQREMLERERIAYGSRCEDCSVDESPEKAAAREKAKQEAMKKGNPGVGRTRTPGVRDGYFG